MKIAVFMSKTSMTPRFRQEYLVFPVIIYFKEVIVKHFRTKKHFLFASALRARPISAHSRSILPRATGSSANEKTVRTPRRV
jgi:hypothetical protein